MDTLYVLILGLLIGSFLNVCIFRVPNKESIVFPPSHCFKCSTRLKPVDLIPVLSYLYYKGRCRYCSQPISIQYPLIEAANAVLYLILYLNFGLSILFIKYSILTSLLLVILTVDLKTMEIPDTFILFGFINGIIFLFFDKSLLWTNAILGMLLGFGVFFSLALIPGAMGGGDIKLMAMLGLCIGWKSILMVTILAFFIGAAFAVPVLLARKKGMKSQIPFGPFIAIAFFITVNWGNRLLTWYMDMIL